MRFFAYTSEALEIKGFESITITLSNGQSAIDKNLRLK